MQKLIFCCIGIVLYRRRARLGIESSMQPLDGFWSIVALFEYCQNIRCALFVLCMIEVYDCFIFRHEGYDPPGGLRITFRNVQYDSREKHCFFGWCFVFWQFGSGGWRGVSRMGQRCIKSEAQQKEYTIQAVHFHGAVSLRRVGKLAVGDSYAKDGPLGPARRGRKNLKTLWSHEARKRMRFRAVCCSRLFPPVIANSRLLLFCCLPSLQARGRGGHKGTRTTYT